jgi:hypothetical protein
LQTILVAQAVLILVRGVGYGSESREHGREQSGIK